jgi:hypothetical protein
LHRFVNPDIRDGVAEVEPVRGRADEGPAEDVELPDLSKVYDDFEIAH